MTNWKEVKLESIADVIMGQSPKSEYYNAVGDGLPFLQGNRTFGLKYPIFDTYTTSPTKIAQPQDVIMSVRAPVGDLNITPVKMCLGRGVCAMRMKNGNQEFLYYLMKHNVQNLLNRESGTVFGSVNRNDIGSLEVLVPENDKIQQKVACVLSLLDAKIETNTRINNNLEQQAQALYVNNIELYKERNIKVEDIVITANTGADAIQKAPIVDYDTGVKCVRVGDMSNKRSYSDWGYAKVTDDVFSQHQLKKDDIIVTRTASLGLNTIISKNLDAVYNNGLIRLTINKDVIVPLLVYRQFQTDDFKNYISKIEGETSVRPNMKINYLLQYSFAVMNKEKQKELIKVLEPLWNKQEQLIEENTRLAAIRDALLPKLMSGEIDVSNVDISALTSTDKLSFTEE